MAEEQKRKRQKKKENEEKGDKVKVVKEEKKIYPLRKRHIKRWRRERPSFGR
eukprot:TRINITY_DN3656_c0_g1_i1.p2 TRINITY_DN3656_c0_g1~~TRINITY_DN3656_c0_g1_i1.p2  ORF type:complete len:52 (-),score=15.73 TRINITY_DN3656_c0_g1_i1:67-222(-)